MLLGGGFWILAWLLELLVAAWGWGVITHGFLSKSFAQSNYFRNLPPKFARSLCLIENSTANQPGSNLLLFLLLPPKRQRHQPRPNATVTININNKKRKSYETMVDQGPALDAQCPSWASCLGYIGVAAAVCMSNWGSAVSCFHLNRLMFGHIISSWVSHGYQQQNNISFLHQSLGLFVMTIINICTDGNMEGRNSSHQYRNSTS